MEEGDRVQVCGIPATLEAILERADGSPAYLVRYDSGRVGSFYDADGLEGLFGLDLVQPLEEK